MRTCSAPISPVLSGIQRRKAVKSPVLFSLVLLALWLGGASPLPAQAPDVKYLRIYDTIEQADALAKRGQTNQARTRYLEAQAALRDFKSLNPNWNTKAVTFRMGYVAEQLDALSKPAGTTSNDSAGPAAVKPSSSSGDAQVKVLAAGAEPRQALRFQVKPGETQTAVITLQMAVGMGDGGLMKIPVIKINLSATPKDVTPEGDINSEIRLEELEVEGDGSAAQMVEAMKTSLGGVKGMLIETTISDRGLSKRAEVKLPPDTDATARQSMEQMKDSLLNTQFLLPEEPIGPGAEWVVKQKIQVQGRRIDQTATHKLVAVDGQMLTVESTIVQSAANQKVPNPAMPQVKVDLTKLAGTSKSQATVDLAKVLPAAATVASTIEMVMSAGAGSQAQAMTMKSETTIKIEGK